MYQKIKENERETVLKFLNAQKILPVSQFDLLEHFEFMNAETNTQLSFEVNMDIMSTLYKSNKVTKISKVCVNTNLARSLASVMVSHIALNIYLQMRSNKEILSKHPFLMHLCNIINQYMPVNSSECKCIVYSLYLSDQFVQEAWNFITNEYITTVPFVIPPQKEYALTTYELIKVISGKDGDCKELL